MEKSIAMMQPYLFPYLGYFQLIAAADAFVLGDDLQYVKESWINRNRILVNKKEKLFTFPLTKSSHLSKINEKFFAENFVRESTVLLKQISNSYANAPCFSSAYPLIEEIIVYPEINFAKYAENSIRKICSYLGINTRIFVASIFALDPTLDKQERVIKTVKKLCGTLCINPIGGVELYSSDYFLKNGVKLRFHRMGDVRYKQFDREFIPSLSIIDVLMFNEKCKISDMLTNYSLESNADKDREF
jgi:hypothetical protein